MRNVLAFAIATLMCLPAYANPTPEEVEDAPGKRRWEVWKKYCNKCHGDGTKATRIGLKRGAPDNLFESVSGKPDSVIRDIINNGYEKMPAYKKKLSVEDVEIILTYLKVGSQLEKLQKINNDLQKTIINWDTDINNKNNQD